MRNSPPSRRTPWLNGIVTILVVLFILWLALGSGRIILAVFLNLFVGLAITAAVGLMMVGALNLISIYFAVLFVGLGVDFGIQFSVRYRAERHARRRSASGADPDRRDVARAADACRLRHRGRLPVVPADRL